MIDDLPDSKKHLPYYFYFDNLFTSVNLLTHLKEHGYRGTGTIRENHIDKSCPLSNSKSFKKNPKGTIEFVRIIEENIIMVRWLDNNVVTIASNVHGSHPTKRFLGILMLLTKSLMFFNLMFSPNITNAWVELTKWTKISIIIA